VILYLLMERRLSEVYSYIPYILYSLPVYLIIYEPLIVCSSSYFYQLASRSNNPECFN